MRVKFIFILLVTLGCCMQSLGQDTITQGTNNISTPAPVPNLNEIQQSKKYYKNQESSWKKVANEKVDNPKAWMNYYKAKRYEATGSTSTDISPAIQSDLDNIIDSMSTTVPDSYEYNLAKYINSNFDVNAFPYLQKAYDIEPNNPDSYGYMIAYYELTFNEKMKKQFCQKLYESHTISDNVFNYNYNVLQSLEQNAIIITNGEMDTYPIWILQEIKKQRKDITLLNLNLLNNHVYRQRKLKELYLNSYEDFDKDNVAFLQELGHKNPSKSIYCALTTNKPIIKQLANNLYLIGLALKYSSQKFDNNAVMVSNWEKNFKTDYLSKLSTSNNTSVKLQQNYLVLLLSLNNYYMNNGEIEKAKKVNQIALNIAKNTSTEKKLNNYNNVHDK